MNAEGLKKEFVSKYTKEGERKFYRFLLLYAVNKIMAISEGRYKGMSPELEFLEYYDQFIILYRRESDETYISLAKLFRKAAHKIYRVMLKKSLTERNAKFLNLV
jgi:hypothetical protein